MNSYTQNFRKTIISCLEKPQSEENAARAGNDAAIFTLYYAREASSLVARQLIRTNEQLSEKEQLKERAAICGNASQAVVQTAARAGQCLKQSATDAAVMASTVQAATDAIIALASDMGSIFSIMSAADIDSELYNQAAALKDLLNETAAMAETGSLHAMEILAQTAAVPAIAVADNTGRVHSNITKIRESAYADFLSARQLSKDRSDQLASLRSEEKTARVNFENSQVVLDTARQTHQFTNDLLNLSLRVSNISLDKCTVSFSPVKNIFSTADLQNPVEAYHILIVKAEKKYLVDFSHAENALQHQWQEDAGQPFKKHSDMHSCILSRDKLKDTDGDPVVAGQEYAVLVYGSYTDIYKKKRNNFDDFLSAPSAPFQFSSPLSAVNAHSITQDPRNPMLLHFEVTEDPLYAESVQYRCIFLPGATYADNAGEHDLGYVCNIDIALQTTADHYLVAKPANPVIKKAGTKRAAQTQWHIKINSDTTDIFGNRLVNGNAYLSLILSVLTVAEDTLPGITNSWSGYQDAKAIIYSSK